MVISRQSIDLCYTTSSHSPQLNTPQPLTPYSTA